MPRNETRSSQFGLISGIRQPSSDMVLVCEPAGLFAPEARKGQMYIVAETDQDVARGRDACLLVMRTIRKIFYEDSSYSVTSALRKAISAANKVLYQQNFSVMAQKRAVVGVTCAVVKGNDLFIAQVAPAQAYVLAEGKLRALPANLAWSAGQAGATPLFKPAAVGASLSIEPEFYRAVLRPGDALLLCSSNLSRLLGREDVMRLLRAPEPADVAEGLLAICKQNALPEAQGLAATVCAPLSPAAQVSPLSRAGISERGALALRAIGGWASRVTGEATLLVKGPAERARRRRAASLREQERRTEAQLATLPEEPTHSPAPPSLPRPLDLGETLDERIEQAREERRTRIGAPRVRPPEDSVPPPSTYLGEGRYLPTPPPERRIDLSDTPGMAALGRHTRPAGSQVPSLTPTIGERLSQPFLRVADAAARIGRRRRLQRPPPNAMPHVRSQQGLSYRRTRPPFPWRLLVMLVLLVALLIVYGNNLLRENSLQKANDVLTQAEQAVAAIREAPDDATAQLRLQGAEALLADLRATGVVTATQENRRRYDEIQREYERDLAAIQRLTYFDDLTEVARHPAPGGLFASVVIPPPPQGITDTAAFGSIYLLDTNAGVLYRQSREGGAIEPFLQPNDAVDSLVVGKLKAQMWRIDNIVAVAQSGENGPFTFFFRNADRWRFSNLAGSEEWGAVDEHFRIANYEGNLYLWGAAAGQVLKYFSGNYGEYATPWIQNDKGQKPDTAIDMAVDGNIYLLQPDGHILVFEAGEFIREIVPQGITPPLVTAANFFVTGDGPENGSIYLVDRSGRILQIDKQTGALIQQIRARSESPLQIDQLINIFVDDRAGQPVLYLVNGGQVLRAALPDQPQPFRAPGTAEPASGTPVPTATP